jgi:hypothetical protein
MLICVGVVAAIAGRDPLGRGGKIGSSAARVEVGAEAAGTRTFCGMLASEAGAVPGGIEARITGGGGAAHPQSKGTSLLTRSILPS